MRVGGRSRAAGWLGAIATGLMSPSLLFMKNMRLDSGPWTPVRFAALVRYGEGPHITALCLLPFALAFTWRRAGEQAAEIAGARRRILRGRGVEQLLRRHVAGDILPAAGVELLHHARRPRHAVSIARDSGAGLRADSVLAVALVLRITLHNMQYVSNQGNVVVRGGGGGGLAAFGSGSYGWRTGRPERTWAVFVAGAVALIRPQRPRQLLREFPRDRRAGASDTGTRPGHHPRRDAGARMAMAASGTVAETGGRGGIDRGLRHHQALRQARAADRRTMARLSVSRGIPRYRLALEKHAGRARSHIGHGALLVRHLARSGGNGRWIGAGSAESHGVRFDVGDRHRHESGAREPLVEGHGGGRDVCGRSCFRRTLQRHPQPGTVFRTAAAVG